MKIAVTIITLLIVSVLLPVSFSGCTAGEEIPANLQPAEITEYEGQDLSSIDDFRPNSIKGTQHIDAENYTLVIDGLVDTPLELTYDDVLSRYPSYRKVVTLNCVEGWSVDILWEGFLLSDLIADAQPSSEVNTVIFRAVDGYTTGLPLDYILENDILIAYKMNGVTLPPERGFPFHLVAESKWGYKWIKWITSIGLSDTEYFGYWETRGYSQEADLENYFYEWID